MHLEGSGAEKDKVEFFLDPDFTSQTKVGIFLWKTSIIQRFNKLDLILKLHLKQLVTKMLMYPGAQTVFKVSSLIDLFRKETTVS